jgi:hypothetical protein
MARNDDDMTDGATDGETAATRRARERAFGQNPLTTDQMAEAIAKAQERTREAEAKRAMKPLPDVIRASVRCGYSTSRRVMSDGSSQMVTSPSSITFEPEDTADGTRVTVPHGRPVKLKREAFLRYQADGQVEFG